MLSLADLASLANEHAASLNFKVGEFSIGDRPFLWNTNPYLMGVINLSPESWYRESVCLNANTAVQRAEVLRAQGAHIIDLGAESTLDHAGRVGTAGQLTRLLPVVEQLAQRKMIISVESYDLAVLQRCLKAGAKVVNLTGTENLEATFLTAAENEAAVIICYVQGPHVRAVGDFDLGRDPVELLRDYFDKTTKLALKCGVTRILIDPGLGFYYRNLSDSSKRVAHQMKVFLNTFRLREFGFPVCHALPHAFEFFGDEVRSAESFFTVLAALGKTSLFRTHEIPKTRAVLETMQAFKP